MSIVENVSQAMQCILNQTADQIARKCGFIQRNRKLTGSTFVQTLVFGWLSNPNATLEELSQTAAACGVQISAQGLEQRFTEKAALFLREVLEAAFGQLIKSQGPSVPILDRFNGVYLADSTIVNLPKELEYLWMGGKNGWCQKAGIKVQVLLDYQHGTLANLELQPARASDQKAKLQNFLLPAGSLRLADLGYFKIKHARQLTAQSVYWLTRAHALAKIADEWGVPCTLDEWLANKEKDEIDEMVQVGTGCDFVCRLLARRVSPEIAQQRRQRLKEDARRRQQQVSERCWNLAEWTVFLTNVPATMMTLEEAFVIARTRWQIELLFKLWKSEGCLDESRSDNPWRRLCEFYAKLLMLIVQHWLLLVSCWEFPDRSLTKAVRTIRKYAFHLAFVFRDQPQLLRAIELICQCLAHGCRINKRSKKLHHFQLLASFP